MASRAFKRAIDIAGGQRALAVELGVTPAFISNCLNERVKIPVKIAIKIEEITQGAVQRSALRPDIYL
jgi:DNA-binding transcriptional regulator YdaS (Cro superfamily)